MVKIGDAQRVRESRLAFQNATTEEFIAAVEEIVQRRVRAFSSATDVEQNVVFENFLFHSEGPSADGAGGPVLNTVDLHL
jgi:hypothetical protein